MKTTIKQFNSTFLEIVTSDLENKLSDAPEWKAPMTRSFMVTLTIWIYGAFFFGPTSAGESEPAKFEIATFAGGCFWCVEADFDQVEGVIKTISGFSGGTLANPTYKEVTAGTSGHVEAVQIIYNPEIVSFENLLDIFWHSIDPIDEGGQFCDRGSPYLTAIFTHSQEQQVWAEESKEKLESVAALARPVATNLAPLPNFYPAEEYHQAFYLKNPMRYKYYRFRCGRNERLEELWGSEALRGLQSH